MAKKSSDAGSDSPSRRIKLQQIKTAFTITRSRDPKLPLYMVLAFVIGAGVIELLGFLGGHLLVFIVPAVLVGVMAAMLVFGRRAQRAAFTQVEGQPGAAAWVLQGMRGDWRVTQAVAATGSLDVVHRVLGKPGIVLIGEGNPHRVRSLLAQEKKRTARVAGDVPIYDITVGNGEGEVPVKKLSSHLLKLPRNLTPKQVTAMSNRLKALGGTRAGQPKGPMPQKAMHNVNERSIRRR